MRSPIDVRRCTKRARLSIAWVSRFTTSATSGRCTFTTTSSPETSVARCTWPIDAAASGVQSKRREHLFDRPAELLLDDLADLVGSRRRHRGLQLRELGDDRRGQQVAAGGRDLAELDEHAAAVLERRAQARPELRVGDAGGRREPAVQQPVVARDAEHLAEAQRRRERAPHPLDRVRELRQPAEALVADPSRRAGR